MDDDEHNPKRMQMIASYVTLPFVLAVPPIVGWYIGSWLDNYFNSAPYAMYILLGAGVIGGAREFYRIVTKYKDDEM
jgi:ATP synthase protein I